jgi:hypothetical protein
VTQKSVVVDLGSSSVRARPRLQRTPAGVQRRFGRAGRDPVLEAIGRDRGFGALGHKKQSGHALIAKIGKTLRIAGPPHELDVHGCNVSSECFFGITAW